MTQPMPPTGSVVPDAVRAAIHAGHVTEVVVFCDECGAEFRGDFIGETRADRLAAARAYMADQHGWSITPEADLCAACAPETTKSV